MQPKAVAQIKCTNRKMKLSSDQLERQHGINSRCAIVERIKKPQNTGRLRKMLDARHAIVMLVMIKKTTMPGKLKSLQRR